MPTYPKFPNVVNFPFAPRTDGSGPQGFNGRGFGVPEQSLEPGGVVQDFGNMPSNSLRLDRMTPSTVEAASFRRYLAGDRSVTLSAEDKAYADRVIATVNDLLGR